MSVTLPESTDGSLASIIECLLFVAGEPLSPDQIASVLEVDSEVVTETLDKLGEMTLRAGGLVVAQVAGGYQLKTRPQFAEVITRFLQPDPQRLSRQAVETLAVVAYRQPITQPDIDALRGVSSSGVLKTLLDRGLIREAGRKDTPGRPILYQTTTEFLKHFGLRDLTQLPSLEGIPVDIAEEIQLRAA